jgi:hypothetical protein
MTTENVQTLRLDEIRIDGGTQPRVAIDQEIVDEYAEQYSTGIDLNPVVVFFDGATYWLADGFHRYWANKKIDCEFVFAEIHQGTQRDAVLYSVGANAKHGLRRTKGDKRKAVLTMLTNPMVSLDDAGNPRSNCDIARLCHVSEFIVRKIRKEQDDAGSSASSIKSKIAQTTRSVTRGKSTYLQDTSKIGRAKNNRRVGGISPNAAKPVRQPRPALAQTNLNLPRDPIYGARAIVAAMGVEYAHQLIESLTTYLNQKKEGAA